MIIMRSTITSEITDFFSEPDKTSYLTRLVPHQNISQVRYPMSIWNKIDRDIATDVLDMLTIRRWTLKQTTDRINRYYKTEHTISTIQDIIYTSSKEFKDLTENLTNHLQYGQNFAIHQFNAGLSNGSDVIFIQDVDSRYIVAYTQVDKKSSPSKLATLIREFKISVPDPESFHVEPKLSWMPTLAKILKHQQVSVIYSHQRKLDDKTLYVSHDNDVEVAWKLISKIHERDQHLGNCINSIFDAFVIYFNYLQNNPRLLGTYDGPPTDKFSPACKLNLSLPPMLTFKDLFAIKYAKDFLANMPKYPRLRIRESHNQIELIRAKSMDKHIAESAGQYFTLCGLVPTKYGWIRKTTNYHDLKKLANNPTIDKMMRTVEICYDCGEVQSSPQQIERYHGFRSQHAKLTTQPSCKKCDKQKPRHKKTSSSCIPLDNFFEFRSRYSSRLYP